MIESQNDLIEPVLDVHEIQGNILAGFNKEHQALLGFTIDDADQAKKWIGLLSKQISTLYEVQNFNKIHKSLSTRLGVKEPPGMNATWTNIAFSYAGISKLVINMEQVDFDKSFKKGLIKSSQSLGDPIDTSAEGNPWNWIIGSSNPNPKSIPVPDVLLIVASDSPESLKAQVSSLISQANSHSLRKIYEETGHDLSYYGDDTKKGHEHFGFKDGISHPGVRGRLSNNPTDYLTPRPEIQQPDPDSVEFSLTGRRPLIAPGQFVIGYPIQNPNHPRKPDPPNSAISKILKNGSYLVYRRLRQDVEAFENFVNRESQRLSQISGFSTINAEKLKALLVGRWPSGAPLALSAEQDDPQLAKDPDKNNNFEYADDEDGYKTPVISHIRKVNPRDLTTDQGFPSETLTFRILRRGIPFGEPFDMSKPDPINGNRGLLFLSYQTSIEFQFELLVNKWMNNVNNPTNAHHPPRSDNKDGGSSGFDILVGQKPQLTLEDPNRARFGYIQAKINNGTIEGRISNQGLNILDWVIPTGGGYFFSPSISSLKFILGSQ